MLSTNPTAEPVARIRPRIAGPWFSNPANDPDTFSRILETLEDIEAEKSSDAQKTKALQLGSRLSSNGSVLLSDTVKSYVISILSNITYVGDRNVTGAMLDNLQMMFQVKYYAVLRSTFKT